MGGTPPTLTKVPKSQKASSVTCAPDTHPPSGGQVPGLHQVATRPASALASAQGRPCPRPTQSNAPGLWAHGP